MINFRFAGFRFASSRPAKLAALLLIAEASVLTSPATAQIYPPNGSQYPNGGQNPNGGQYPNGGQGGGGLSIPGLGGRNRNKNSTTTTSNGDNPNQNAPASTFLGRLRRLGKGEMAVETDDHRVLTIGVGQNTRYFDDQGKSATLGDFFPGDRISVDASSDNQSYLHAVRVRLERAGSASDRATAGEGISESPVAVGSVSNDGDDDRPKLRRAKSSDPASNKSSNNNGGDDDRPVLKRKPDPGDAPTKAKSTDDDYVVPVERRPTQASVAATAKQDPDDSGPPMLRRGKPTDTRTSQSSNTNSTTDDNPVLTARNNRDTVRPQIIDGDPPITDNRRAEAYSRNTNGDPIIEKAREVAFDFIETLPNYTVKQFTTRFQSEPGSGKVSWQALDNVTADVIQEGGKESYRNILVNGKAPKEAVEKTGSWSSGEFSSVLQDVLSPVTDARFYNKRSSTIVNRPATRYDFSVEQPNSHWHVYAASQSYQPSYKGAIWIDKETSRVLRIEMSAKNMPDDFPLDQVESATDYDFVRINDGKFLLPVHSEALSCGRGTACSRNVIDFRNYRKYGADSSITFDADPTDGPAKPTPKKK